MSWRASTVRGAMLLMETFWVYALVALLAAAGGNAGEPSPFGVAAVVFTSFLISRALQQSDLDLGVLRVWGTIASLLLFYAIVRVDLFDSWRLWDFGWADQLFNHGGAATEGRGGLVIAAVLLWAFWLRGILRGQEEVTFDGVVTSFAAGVVIIVIVELLARPAGAPWAVRQIAVPYMAVGLLSISLTNAGQGEADYGKSFSSTWLVAVGGSVLLLSIVAVLFVLFDFGTMVHAIIAVGHPIVLLAGKAIYYIIYPILLVIQGLVDVFVWIAGGRHQQPPQAQPTPPPPNADNSGGGSLPGWLGLLFKLFGLGAMGAVIVLGIALLFKRYERRREPEEVKETTYQEGRLGMDLGGMFGSMLNRLRFSPRSGLDPARRLYFDLLNAAAQRGIEREPGETPLELAPRLDQAFAAQTPGRITSLFDDVHFGGLTPSPGQVRTLREEWDRVRRSPP